MLNGSGIQILPCIAVGGFILTIRCIAYMSIYFTRILN